MLQIFLALQVLFLFLPPFGPQRAEAFCLPPGGFNTQITAIIMVDTGAARHYKVAIVDRLVARMQRTLVVDMVGEEAPMHGNYL